MGVKDSLDTKTDWAPKLKDLLDAHHYTSGLSFIPSGTPSNNTADEPSGFSSNDPGYETSYLSEIKTPAIKRGDFSNADTLTTALGLSDFDQFFADASSRNGKRSTRRTTHEHGTVVGDVGLFPVADAWRRQRDRKREPTSGCRYRLGTQPLHRFRARHWTTAGDPRGPAAVRCSAGYFTH